MATATKDRNQLDRRATTEVTEPEHRRPRTTIRFQLLVAVNATAAFLVAVFLTYDFQRELGERLKDTSNALEEEAKTLLLGVLQMNDSQNGNVQEYIDAVCQRMREAQSPGHHIAVQSAGGTIQASAHHRASSEILAAMQKAADSPNRRARYQDTELVVGVFSENGSTVYVSESLDNVRKSVMGNVVRRIVGIAVSALVVGLLVNLILWRVVTHPLEQLVGVVKQIGSGNLGAQSEPFRSVELDYLAGEVNTMSMSLEKADRERKSQMAKARQIQENLLPDEIVAPALTVVPVFQPADDVGGDYYDAFLLNDGSWLVVVADVMGHGVPAAMSAAMLKVLLMQAVDQFTSPAQILESVNRRFASVSLSGDFVTIFLARIATKEGVLDYASAGHEPACLISPTGQVSQLPATGMLLGIDEAGEWKDIRIDSIQGYRLVIVTDGVTETANAEGTMFGKERLAALLSDVRGLPLEQAASRINDVLTRFRGDRPQNDDFTFMMVGFAQA